MPPTRDTGDPRVAAFLWIKEPGGSDGDCRGSPSAGQFMPDYALGLAKATKSS
jgi:endoglucanase